MNKYIRYSLSLVGLFMMLPLVQAQSSIDRVLREVEVHNKTLQADCGRIAAQKIEASFDNNLPDPTVTYSHQYGNRDGLGIQGELVASQSFDFPTLYTYRSRLAKAKGEGYDREGDLLRQEILLEAKEVCLDLIALNQQKKLLDTRLDNAERLAAIYEKRLAEGDANQLEVNKIRLELLNAKNEARLNDAERKSKLDALAALNGGESIAFADTVYLPVESLSFSDLRQETLAADRSLLSLRNEQTVALRQLRVSKAGYLPGFELGYRLNTAVGGDRFNGFLVGISVPLFANRNHVKQAKAQQRFADLQLEQATTALESDLIQLYNEAEALKTSIDEYRAVLGDMQNLTLLNKAIEAGQISMVDYFVEVTTIYDSQANYIRLQNDYQKTIARLYRWRL